MDGDKRMADSVPAIRTGPDGRLRVTYAGRCEIVAPVRCFPWTHPRSLISLRTDDGVEITLMGYARAAHQDWTTSVPGVGESARSNASPIEFATITEAGSADYWAIFDDAVAGNLLRFGTITDFIGAPTPVVFSGAPEEARITIGAIVIRVQDV